MSINRVVISGNLTRDAELRATASGMSILNLGIAVNDRRRNPQTGEWEDYANYIDCVLFGNRGPAIQSYLTKGTKVLVEGKLRWSQWERDGQKRSKIEVVVDEIEFMSPRNGNNGGNAGSYGGNAGAYGGNSGAYGGGMSYGQAQPQVQPQVQPQQAAPQAQPQMQPQQTTYGGAPVIDASSAVYDEDIPF